MLRTLVPADRAPGGGFTTYSAFAYATYFLGREQARLAAVANVALHVMVGLGALWVGHQLVTR